MKKDKNRKLQGSVLLTVVFVMAILIVFLFGTMSLAIAANNRSHVNYSSAQTGITARAVAESAIKAVANDSDIAETYAKAVAGLEEGQELTVGVDLSSHEENRIGTMGNVSNVTISHVGTTKFYDPIKNQWEDRDVLKFTATVDMAGVQSTSSVYVVKHLERDKSLGGGGGAGFVTTAGAVLKTQTSIFGGAYINLPEENEAKQYIYTGTYEDRMANRTFDNKGNGIEANINRHFLENEGAVIEADLVVNNDMYIQNWSGVVFPGKGKGITVWGDMMFDTDTFEDFEYVMVESARNSLVNDKNEINFNEIPYIYVDGKIKGEDNIVRLGNDNQNFPLNTFCASIEAGRLPKLDEYGNQIIDEWGNQQFTDNGKKSILASNIYCMDKELTSQVRMVANSALYSWAESTVKKVTSTKRTTEIEGEICSKGNLVLEEVTVDGDVRVEGTLTAIGDVVVKGDVVAGKIENINNITIDGGGKIYANVSNIGFYYVYTPEMNEEGKFVAINGEVLNDSRFTDGEPNEEYAENIPEIYHILETGWYPSKEGSKDHVTGNEENTDYFYFDSENLQVAPQDEVEKAYIDMLPPGGVIDTNNLAGYKIDTNTDESEIKSVNDYIAEHGSIYPEYAEREAVLGINGYGADTKVARTLEEIFNKISNPYDAAILPSEHGADTIYEDLKEQENGDYTGRYEAQTTITKSCVIDSATFANGLILDPTAVMTKSMVVVIRGNVTIQNAPLYVNDTSGKKVYIYIQNYNEIGGKLTLSQGSILTNTYKDLIQNSSLGYNSTNGYNIKQNSKHIPNVYIYGDVNSELDIQNMSIITAYVKSPYISATIGGGQASSPTSFYYNNYNIMQTNKQLVIGCFNVKEVTSANPVNTVYISEKDDDGGGTVDQKGEYWYRPYYYSEF